MKNIIKCLLILAAFHGQGLFAQFYETGQSPGHLSWRQINTSRFRLIYPETFDSLAPGLARLLEESWELAGQTLGHQPDRIPVIVHNHHARSNGMVVWAPKRMELFPIPPQGGRGGDWLTQLVLHEQRHVVQVNKLNQGITRIFSFLVGEQAIGATAGRIPPWFYEGDAVVTETTLTLMGRGRRPSFDMPLRTLLVRRDEIFSYDKYLHGSFRDHVPDHYQHGYYMVSSLRLRYGPSLWENAIDFTARRPWYLTPFMRSLRNETGKSIGTLHMEVLAGKKEELEPAHDVDGYPEYNVVNRRRGIDFINYRFPAWSNDTVIIAHKSGMELVDQIVMVGMEGRETRLTYTGQFSSPVIAVHGSRVAWSEFRPDLRWSLAERSVVRVYDFKTGQSNTIGSKSRYFSPAFAPGGLFLAVVETDFQNKSRILLINSVTGDTAASYPAPQGKSIQQPAFSPDGRRIFVIGVCRSGSSILSIDMETGNWDTLLQPSHVEISRVFPCHGMVCLTTDITGKKNILALDEEEGELYQLTRAAFGISGGDISGSGKLVFSDYRETGFDLALTGFEPGLRATSELKHIKQDLVRALSSDEKGIVIEIPGASIPDPEPYRKFTNLFRFHSWAPFYFDYSGLNIEQLPVWPGLTLLSQNLLNTANTLIGYSYLEGNHVVHGNFSYRGWFPVIEAGFDFGGERLVYPGRDTLNIPEVSNGQFNLNGSVYLPLNLSAGRYIAGVQPGMVVNYSNSLYHYEGEDAYRGGMTTIEARLFAFRYARRSQRDLFPRWGQVLLWRRFNAPFESENLGSIASAELTLYFPGIMPHHSLRLAGVLQWQDPVKYFYNSIVNFPRGYSREISEDLRVFRSSYSFPFLYPDFNIPGILYIKRFSGDLFADAGISRVRVNNDGRREWHEERLFSWGGGITTNFHVLRLIFPINLSAWIAYIPGRQELTPIFSVNMDF